MGGGGMGGRCRFGWWRHGVINASTPHAATSHRVPAGVWGSQIALAVLRLPKFAFLHLLLIVAACVCTRFVVLVLVPPVVSTLDLRSLTLGGSPLGGEAYWAGLFLSKIMFGVSSGACTSVEVVAAGTAWPFAGLGFWPTPAPSGLWRAPGALGAPVRRMVQVAPKISPDGQALTHNLAWRPLRLRRLPRLQRHCSLRP